MKSEQLFLCPGMAHRQEMAKLGALETSEGVASISAPLHFWAEETEMCAHWRSLRPGTPYVAGLAAQSSEGTEEERHRALRRTAMFPSSEGATLISPWPWASELFG